MWERRAKKPPACQSRLPRLAGNFSDVSAYPVWPCAADAELPAKFHGGMGGWQATRLTDELERPDAKIDRVDRPAGAWE